jgi:CRP/FNR family transcriptional regulator, cyclic AMP receptor protein
MTAKTAPKDTAFLSGLAVFGGIPADELERLAARLEVRTIEGAGELFAEGTAAREMYVVREGELEVSKKNNMGADVRVATLRAGDCVGEMGLIDIQPRSATVRTLGPATLLVLSNTNLSEIAHSAPKAWTLLVMNIAREISRRLRRADELLVKIDEPVDVEDLWRNWKPSAS